MNIQIAAGNGVYLRCHNKKYILPGTLLGFFPGIIYDGLDSTNEIEEKEYPALRRYDNYCIEYKNVTLPFPVKPGLCMFIYTLALIEYEKIVNDYKKKQDYPNHFFYVLPEMINPLALGHKINHPPNSPNVILLDFDIPRTFFPEAYYHYLPYIEYLPSLVISTINRIVKE